MQDSYCEVIQAEYNVLLDYGKGVGWKKPWGESKTAMFDWCKLEGFNGLLVVTARASRKPRPRQSARALECMLAIA